jgi:two-component system, OmpR family, sensor histidine kinase MtrB
VQDHGPGIPEDLLLSLFTRFVARSGGESRAKSTGLGLAFVKAVAERHGGSVSAENIKGKGARFNLIVPEAPDPA